MHLSTGTSLGPYEICAPIGSGGMGEVCRATDTTADGRIKRFAVLLPPDAVDEQKPPTQMTFLFNFFDELRRRVPVR